VAQQRVYLDLLRRYRNSLFGNTSISVKRTAGGSLKMAKKKVSKTIDEINERIKKVRS